MEPRGARSTTESEMGPAEVLGGAIREAALGLGFARVGFSPVERFDAAGRALLGWLEQGYQGEMAYLAGSDDRADAGALLDGARTLIVVALAYPRAADVVELHRKPASGEPRGTVASYARGRDYHDVIRHKLRALADACARIAGRPVLARHCVDTAPLLEREAARRSGIGFVAKSTMLIAPGLGTHVLLGELLIDFDVGVAPVPEPAPSGCGACRACLDACPTGAFVGEHVLDARRCISYLTIELKGPVPRELRAAVGTRVFGCDVCQDVCPFNAAPAARPWAPEMEPYPGRAELDLVALLELTSAGYRKLVRRTALRRTTRAQLARNAAVALGNAGDASAVGPLARAVGSHASPLVRGHAAWALGRLGGAEARDALDRAARADPDAFVRDEAQAALHAL